MSWQAGLGIGLGIIGVLGTLFTAGTSLVACGGIMAALESASAVSVILGGAAVTADITGIASAALEENSPSASGILGWVSLAAGSISLGSGLIPSAASASRTSGQLTLGLDDEIQRVQALGRTTRQNGETGMAVRFDDILPGGGRRLNILAHGVRPETARAASRMLIGGTRQTPVELEALLTYSGVNYGDYQRIRLLSCYSANGYSTSFAGRLAILTHLPTTGFKGEVTVQGDALEAMDHASAMIFSQVRGGPQEEERVFNDAFGLYRMAMPDAIRRSDRIFLRTVSTERGINYHPLTYHRHPSNRAAYLLNRAEDWI
jgi:hypothetical protein